MGSSIKVFYDVELIDGVRDLVDSKMFRGWTWDKTHNWIASVPVDIANECAKYPNTFKIIYENVQVPKNELEAFDKRLAALENAIAELYERKTPIDSPTKEPQVEQSGVSAKRGRPHK